MRFALALLICLIPVLSAEAQDNWIQTADKVNRAVVEVHGSNVELFYAGRPDSPKSRNLIVREQAQSGAGIIISPDGVVATNLHIIYNFKHIAVQLMDGRSLKAELLTVHPSLDIALLKIDLPNALYAPLADSNKLSLGEEVLHIGNSYLLKKTLTQGKIIGLGHSEENAIKLIKIKMNLYKGDSGGPVLNKNGELVGMIQSRSSGKNNFALAISSNTIKHLYEQTVD